MKTFLEKFEAFKQSDHFPLNHRPVVFSSSDMIITYNGADSRAAHILCESCPFIILIRDDYDTDPVFWYTVNFSDNDITKGFLPRGWQWFQYTHTSWCNARPTVIEALMRQNLTSLLFSESSCLRKLALTVMREQNEREKTNI